MVRLDVRFCGGCLCYRYCLNLILSLLYVHNNRLASRFNTILEVHLNSGGQPWIMYLNVIHACKYSLKKENIRNFDVGNFFLSMIVDFLL